MTGAPSLSAILRGLATVPASHDRPVHGLVADSRQVTPGAIFVALQGRDHHGIAHLKQAVEAGASAIVAEGPLDDAPVGPVPLLVVPGLRAHLPVLARRMFGPVAEQLTLIGVTGTDGKTSTTQYLAQVLGRCGIRCAVLGTLGAGFPGSLTAGSLTTPDILSVWRALAGFRDAGATHVAMEVSSHALDQGRVAGLRFPICVFTNLSRDHLDYHGDMASYGAVKRRLFTDYGARHAVINLDDAFGRQLANELDGMSVTGYGLGARPEDWDGAWLGASSVQPSPAGLGLELRLDDQLYVVGTPLFGRFNAANLMAVCAAVRVLDLPAEALVGALTLLSPVPGRMERIRAGADAPTVVVDYAHAPTALASALAALREHISGRLICVFGCGGDRDRGKRPLMAAAAEAGADSLIITNDNPRSEDPARIAADAVAGLTRPDAAQVILDRREAIATAIAMAGPRDGVLIAGKGHEDYQIVGARRLHFDDREVARHCLGVAA